MNALRKLYSYYSRFKHRHKSVTRQREKRESIIIISNTRAILPIDDYSVMLMTRSPCSSNNGPFFKVSSNNATCVRQAIGGGGGFNHFGRPGFGLSFLNIENRPCASPGFGYLVGIRAYVRGLFGK